LQDKNGIHTKILPGFVNFLEKVEAVN
jgi:hypothetical protein